MARLRGDSKTHANCSSSLTAGEVGWPEDDLCKVWNPAHTRSCQHPTKGPSPSIAQLFPHSGAGRVIGSITRRHDANPSLSTQGTGMPRRVWTPHASTSRAWLNFPWGHRPGCWGPSTSLTEMSSAGLQVIYLLQRLLITCIT